MDPTNDSESTSLGGYPESTQPRTLSSEERTLFNDLFKALDSLVLERCAERQAFRPIYGMPSWADRVITRTPDQPNQDLWVAKSDFLDSYITLAAEHWWDEPEDEPPESLQWEEAGLDLEVIAMAIGHRKLLMIKNGLPSVRDYKQRMQEKRQRPQRPSELS